MKRQGLSPARLEAFSDGVIAVIITILVLELRVPEPNGLAGLRVVLPAVFLYLLTFVQIGIYWVNHHYLVDEVETVSHGILWANLLFLFCLSLFPFATEWIGVKGLSSFTTSLSMQQSVSSLVSDIWRYGVRFVPRVPPQYTQVGASRSRPSYFTLTAIPMAYFRPAASLALIAIVSVLWLLPPKSKSHPE